MCGIAGAIDLVARRHFPKERLLRMTAAIAHRGPDDEQVHIEPGVALGTRRLAIIDLTGGRQPLANETHDVWVSFEGELYDHDALREKLRERGHHFATRCDTECWVHLYEDVGEGVFHQARGQFSTALWDRTRRKLLLARDRVGIGPLFYTEVDGWLLWASEIKGLLASGMVEAEPDPRGIDYVFNFFAMPNERTCFQNIRQLPPGHFARVHDGRVAIEQYWDLDFPAEGREIRYSDSALAVSELEDRLRAAVRRRLVSDVPVSCYLSGGLDSTVALALACQERGEPVPSFTIGLDRTGPLDERAKAAETARFFGSKNTIVNVSDVDICNTYPQLVTANEGPVIDTSCAALVRLAAANRAAGNIVAITGEGADEALAGYVWFKYRFSGRLNELLDNPLERSARWLMLSRLIGSGTARRPPFHGTDGMRLAQQISWEIIGSTREFLYSDDMWDRLHGHDAYDDLQFPTEKMRRWDPLNQSLYAAYKVLLPGMLLMAKGDRAIRSASTEGRYPFLDEEVVEYCSQIAPEYKLRGWADKWLLRRVAERVAPAHVQTRRKVMFRANMGTAFLNARRPAWIDELLAPESLEATGYFDPMRVDAARKRLLASLPRSLGRFALDMGLAGVVSTQLWHHLYCGGGLCSLPVWAASATAPTRTSVPSVA
jgi:asparagine synthase (glutamine-hydrolysing)